MQSPADSMPEPANAAASPDNSTGAAMEMAANLVSTLHRLASGARAVLADQLFLLALETRRAGRAVATMLACGIGAGLLMAGFWLACTAALALWIMERGFAPSLAMLAASLWNLLGVLILLLWLNRVSKALAFPASVQSLRTTLQQADKAKDAP